MSRKSTLFTTLATTLIASSTFAQSIDTVYLKSDPKPVAGEITAVTRNSVTVNQKIARKDVEVPANDIIFISWNGEPPVLNLARSNERAGNLSDAVTGYQEALSAIGSGNANIKTDVNFYIARTAAKLAQTDPAQQATAIKQLKDFADQNRTSYRYYDAQMLLAEVALLAKDVNAAESAYVVLEQSPWPDYQMAAKNGKANALLARDDIPGAKRIFDEVASTNANNPAEQSRRFEAMLGQATCLQKQSGYAEAGEILNKIVDETSAEQSRVLAEAYMKLGDGHAAQGKNFKAAILAYLHVDVIPSLSAHSDLHAEALFRLAKLWPAVNQPARGADASAKLEAEYPNSPWLKQLGGG